MKSDLNLETQGKEIFQKLFDHVADSWNSGDRNPYINVCTDDCVYMVPNASVIIGKANIRDFVLSFPDVHTWYTIVEVFGKSDLTLVRGNYEIKFPDGSPMEHGKFLSRFLFTNEDEWKQTHTIWNSDLPIPGQK